ncbi:hypothetical protein [Claveliimonas bilis]|uniref:Uncharacterized protein n=1 Tax=Claveliimonas bilis TaxID=3028070 RepID=A0ABN6YZ80_9FIRM|nr:hypothetical protein [Claveliimonas bilis]BDZ78706.1 hypothetical protein Lac1_28890 [Claveliimonas bilis]
MVNGIDLFKEHFSDYKEQYTIIGGFACDLLMTDAGLDFRQTVDIDMVIIIEALTTEFASAFWTFIDDGVTRHAIAAADNRNSIVLSIRQIHHIRK